MNYKDKYTIWKSDDFFDIDTRKELKELKDEKEVVDRFYMDLEFGTGGMRGLMGAGTNRLNKWYKKRVSILSLKMMFWLWKRHYTFKEFRWQKWTQNSAYNTSGCCTLSYIYGVNCAYDSDNLLWTNVYLCSLRLKRADTI